jgi:hypothetical protein
MTYIALATRRILLAFPLLAVLAACDTSPTTTDQPDAGTITFSYQGAGPNGDIAGTYRAEGYPRADIEPARQTYAVGHRYPGAQTIEAISNASHGEVFDFATLTIPRLTPGTVVIDRFCGTDHCPELTVALEIPQVHGAQARYSCTLETGSITITSVNGGRAKGRFSGEGFCGGRPGAAGLDRFTVQDGEFDVRLRDAQG